HIALVRGCGGTVVNQELLRYALIHTSFVRKLEGGYKVGDNHNCLRPLFYQLHAFPQESAISTSSGSTVKPFRDSKASGTAPVPAGLRCKAPSSPLEPLTCVLHKRIQRRS